MSGITATAPAGDCPWRPAADRSIAQAATTAAAKWKPDPMPTDVSEWITRKQGATLGRCSQDAIKATQKKEKLATRTGPGGAILLRTADLVRVGRIRPEDLTAAASGAECAELVGAREQVAQLCAEVGRHVPASCQPHLHTCRAR